MRNTLNRWSDLYARFRSEAVLATILIGVGGIGFSLGNLLLARVLDPRAFGSVALFLAWSQIGLIAGTFGLETAVIRHGLHAQASLLRLLLLISIPIALVTAVAAALISGLDATLAVAVAITVVAASMARVAVAFFQSAQRLLVAMLIWQINNYVLLAIAPLLAFVRAPQSWHVAAIVGGCYVLTAAAAWHYAPRATETSPDNAPRAGILLREGMAIIGAGLAGSILFQLERLVIPRTLSIETLATFAAIAAVAGAPFRMLQLGVGFTLMPRLRRCAQRSDVGRLLRKEGLMATVVALLAGAAVLVATPWIHEHFLMGRYEITTTLAATVVVIGLVRVWESLASATVTALGTPGDLLLLNHFTWCAVAVGAALATYGSRWGLIGVVLGAGFAWLAIAVVGSMLSVRVLRRKSWRALS